MRKLLLLASLLASTLAALVLAQTTGNNGSSAGHVNQLTLPGDTVSGDIISSVGKTSGLVISTGNSATTPGGGVGTELCRANTGLYWDQTASVGLNGDDIFCSGIGSPVVQLTDEDTTVNSLGDFEVDNSAGNKVSLFRSTAGTTACPEGNGLVGDCGGIFMTGTGAALVLSDATGNTVYQSVASGTSSVVTVGDNQASGSSTNIVSGTTGGIQFNGVKVIAAKATAPTIASGFGTSPSVLTGGTSRSFRVNVGTGGTASSGVITLPAAADAWSCSATDATTQSTSVFLTKAWSTSTTSVTVTNYNTSGAATAWTASDVLQIICWDN